jgi:SnoaL-like polyketide cyclase
MNSMVDRLLQLWASPPAPGEQALADFRTMYADPLKVNGNQVLLEQLVLRARVLHAAFVEVRFEVLSTLEAPGRVAVVFRQWGRHVGPLPTPVGDLEPTGRVVDILVIDVLDSERDLITEVWSAGDELGRLMQLEALASLSARAEAGGPPASVPDVAE